jgi:hypothetical protein
MQNYRERSVSFFPFWFRTRQNVLEPTERSVERVGSAKRSGER